MFNEELKIKIIKKKEVKVGDIVLFHRHKVKVLAIGYDKWCFSNDEIGELTMPVYSAYYKVMEKRK